MVKKISTIALAGLLALPAVVKAQSPEDYDEVLEKVDLISRIQFSGDFRSRLDYYSADMVSGKTLENETNLTNRFRLNIRAKATENVEFKGRLAYYKTWGMPSGLSRGYDPIDGDVTRQPNDGALYVDRAFMNWNNIGGVPIWFSIGRRPTTDGPPANLRMGVDERMATPTAFMDWPFDGISMGYAYSSTARVRFCWGRGFEAGLVDSDASHLNDTDFAGISWDIYKKGNTLAYLQSFMAFNVFNYPADYYDVFSDPVVGYAALLGPRDNIGNILHTSGVWMDKVGDLNYFVAAGWSMTQPKDNTGMFNDPIGMMMGTVTGPNDSNENGYSGYVGVRYDLDDMGLKLGAEYNYGSEYWVGMTPGHDDLYQAKLATRGSVYEAYMIYDLPSGEAISQYGKAFMRLGYQHYEYDYTGSGDWNIKPYDIDSPEAQIFATMMDTAKSADQVYLTFEMYF